MKTEEFTNLNIRVSKTLMSDFLTGCDANDTTVSQVTRELMRAYLELCARAKGRRLPRLDLCGFEESNQSKGVIFPTTGGGQASAPSLRRVAEPQGTYKTGRTDLAKTMKTK